MKIDNKNYYELVMACLFCRKVEEKKRLIQSCSNRHIVPVLMGLLNVALQTNADSSGVARILDRGGSSSHAAKGGNNRVAASVGGSGGMLPQKIFDILDALR